LPQRRRPRVCSFGGACPHRRPQLGLGPSQRRARAARLRGSPFGRMPEPEAARQVAGEFRPAAAATRPASARTPAPGPSSPSCGWPSGSPACAASARRRGAARRGRPRPPAGPAARPRWRSSGWAAAPAAGAATQRSPDPVADGGHRGLVRLCTLHHPAGQVRGDRRRPPVRVAAVPRPATHAGGVPLEVGQVARDHGANRKRHTAGIAMNTAGPA
jgi:hypothetical protein